MQWRKSKSLSKHHLQWHLSLTSWLHDLAAFIVSFVVVDVKGIGDIT